MINSMDNETENILIKAHRFTHNAMATVFEIRCIHEDAAYAAKAAQAAFDLIDRIETELSQHRSSGDIARVNRLKSGSSTQVGPWAMECLLMAAYFYRQTGKAFDISLGSGLEQLELLPQQSSVRAHKDGIRLNLGGIGKGYAIDRAAELLDEWGIRQALLHGGFSSVLALDAPVECGWPLTISIPGARSNAVLRHIRAQRESWSGSGIRKKDHIIDPRSGNPVRGRPAAWVSGRLDALAGAFPRRKISGLPEDFFETGNSPSSIAETLSTAFMIMSFDEIASFCMKHTGVEAYILSSDPLDPSRTPLLTSFTLTHPEHGSAAGLL
jgi:thiamine biosynthesis lipoprotein